MKINYERDVLRTLEELLNDIINQISSSKERKFLNPIWSFQNDLIKVRKRVLTVSDKSDLEKLLSKLNKVLNTIYDKRDQKISKFKENLHLSLLHIMIMCDHLLPDKNVPAEIVELRKIINTAANNEVAAIEDALNSLEKSLKDQKSAVENDELMLLPEKVNSLKKEFEKLEQQRLSNMSQMFKIKYVMEKVYEECPLDMGYARCTGDHPHVKYVRMPKKVRDYEAEAKIDNQLKNSNYGEKSKEYSAMSEKLNTSSHAIKLLKDKRERINQKLEKVAFIKARLQKQDRTTRTKTPWPFSLQQIKDPGFILSELSEFKDPSELKELLKACRQLSAVYSEIEFSALILYAKHLQRTNQEAEALNLYHHIMREGSSHPKVIQNAKSAIDSIYAEKITTPRKSSSMRRITERITMKKDAECAPDHEHFNLVPEKNNKSKQLQPIIKNETDYPDFLDTLIAEIMETEECTPEESNENLSVQETYHPAVAIEREVYRPELAIVEEIYHPEVAKVSENPNALFAGSPQPVGTVNENNNHELEMDAMLAQLAALSFPVEPSSKSETKNSMMIG